MIYFAHSFIMCPLFLNIGHLYSSAMLASPAVKIGYQKDMCDDEVGLCAQSSYAVLD